MPLAREGRYPGGRMLRGGLEGRDAEGSFQAGSLRTRMERQYSELGLSELSPLQDRALVEVT